MTIQHAGETRSNEVRRTIAEREPVSLRTYTPTQMAIAKSAGPFHWTVDGRRLYDYTSGVLVANLGHNPAAWQRRFLGYMGWGAPPAGDGYFEAVPLTAYNAIAQVEADAVRRLTASLQSRPGGGRLEQILWAASGSEAIQKALWASLARDPSRQVMVATRDGFHGKKGLAEAVTGSEQDRNRDPRVRFISFPKEECRDLDLRGAPFLWWVMPSSTPSDLADRLTGRGLVSNGSWPGYAIRIEALEDPPPVDGLEIRRVRAPEELDTYLGVYIPILSPSPAFTETFVRGARRIGLDEDAPEEHFIGLLNGEPVATASLVTAGGAAGIYNVTTVEAARGRGIGAAMTVAAARHGAAHGLGLATLQASTMGRPIYERLGFEFVCDLRPYRLP